MYLNKEVKLYSKNTSSNTWSDTPITISTARDIRVVKGIGKTKDTWEMKIRNPNNYFFDGTDGFKIDDRIQIHFFANKTTSSTNDLLMDGAVREPAEDIDAQNITLRGNAMAESVLRTQAWLATEGSADLLIRETLREVNSLNQLNIGDVRYIYGGELSEWTNPAICNNPTAKHDASAFPTKAVSKKYTNAFELIEEFSSPEMTEDGEYYFYLDYSTDNKWIFKWRYRENTVAGYITESTNETAMQVTKVVDKVINALIINCGADAYGHTIEDFVINDTAVKSVGQEIRYYTKTSDIASTIMQNEVNADTSKAKFNWDSEGNLIDKFPVSYPYSFVMITGRDSDGVKNGTTVTVNNDPAFNKAVRTEARWQGKEVAMKVIRLYSNPRVQAKITFPRGTGSYELGKIYNITSPSYNLTNKPLRLAEISYNFYDLDLTFEEDDTTATM